MKTEKYCKLLDNKIDLFWQHMNEQMYRSVILWSNLNYLYNTIN